MPETRHCAWVAAYLAGQYQNNYINIDLTGGIGMAMMQAYDDLRSRMRSEEYQNMIRKVAEAEIGENCAKREAAGENLGMGHNQGPGGSSTIFCPPRTGIYTEG